MSHLKSYRLPSFTLTVRELTDDERTANRDTSRDYLAIDIRAKGENTSLVCVVGSPVVGDWNEDSAARSAISFASEPSAWDDASEREWVEDNGETLSNEAFNHGILGREMRQGCS